MNIFRPTRTEWASFWLLMPVIAFITIYLLFGARIWQEGWLFVSSFVLAYGIGFVSWYTHIVSMHQLAVWMPDLRQTALRLLILVSVHFLLISATMYAYFYGAAATQFWGYVLDKDKLGSAVWTGLFLTMIATSVWQVEYIFNKWKLSVSERELVEQQQLLHEFEALKRQINPHFLFNNLNILSSLIAEDAGRAMFFLDELSKVYRYLLRNNEEGITTLDSELKFIRSYYALLQIRHGDAVRMTVNVDNDYLPYQLPALCLQLLVENAVKHNVANKARPLFITIATDGRGNLVVSNNRQKKTSNILSNQVGLSNIAANYQLLLNRELLVEAGEHTFSVVLPLICDINPLSYERFNHRR